MSNSGNVDVTSADVLVMILRYLLYLIFPPLAVVDKGCGTIMLVLLFTLFGWLPGAILAFLICIRDRNYFRKSDGDRA